MEVKSGLLLSRTNLSVCLGFPRFFVTIMYPDLFVSKFLLIISVVSLNTPALIREWYRVFTREIRESQLFSVMPTLKFTISFIVSITLRPGHINYDLFRTFPAIVEISPRNRIVSFFQYPFCFNIQFHSSFDTRYIFSARPFLLSFYFFRKHKSSLS